MESGWVAAGTLGTEGCGYPYSPGAEELAETSIHSRTCLWKRQEYINWAFWKERKMSDQLNTCWRNAPVFLLAAAQKMLSSNEKAISQAQPVMLTCFKLHQDVQHFLRGLSQVQQGRNNIISLRVISDWTHFQKWFSMWRWKSWGTAVMAKHHLS